MDDAHAGAVQECRDVGSRRAAISTIEIDDDSSLRQARTRATSRVEPRPFTVAPLPGVGLTEAYRSCQEHMQATCTSAATLAVAVPRSRRSRSPTVHLIGGPAHTRHQPRRAVAYRIASSREHRLTEA